MNIKIIRTIGLSFALVTLFLFNACKKDNNLSTKKTELNVSLKSPENIQNVSLKNATITFKEINSGSVYTTSELVDNKIKITLLEGSYDVTLEGTIEYKADGESFTSKVRGYQNGLIVNGVSSTLDLKLFLYNDQANFVIKEIFFTGTLTPEGKKYNGDKYFIIYNNSDEILFADGLIIAQSEFLTTSKKEYSPDIMSSAFSSGEIVMVPGDGNDYPIEPGKSFIVANNAINHLEYNSNSLDLTKADFELGLISTINVDNPEVTDLENVTNSLLMHDRGYKSFVLAKLDGTIEDFKANNKYTYSYFNGINEKTMETYKIPNKSILDAVNLSVASEFEWIVTDPSLDMGWTYCGKLGSDPNRYGKSVTRKVLSTTPDGREILKDTNNSTVDFEPETRPSLFK